MQPPLPGRKDTWTSLGVLSIFARLCPVFMPVVAPRKRRSFENSLSKSMRFLAQIFLPAEFPSAFGVYKQDRARRIYTGGLGVGRLRG